MKRGRKKLPAGDGRKVLAVSVRGPIYQRLKAICVAESVRLGEPLPVSRYVRELIARTVAEADKQ